MEKIQEYKIVSTHEESKLVVEVNKLIEQGFQPLGGVCVNEVRPTDFYQAMVKYETRKPGTVTVKKVQGI